jgi:hypothetical protein
VRYLIGLTYLLIASSLLPLLADLRPDGDLSPLLLRSAVWLIATAGPLLCAAAPDVRGVRSTARRGDIAVLQLPCG